jgi:hypothetical protein
MKAATKQIAALLNTTKEIIADEVNEEVGGYTLFLTRTTPPWSP